MYQPTTALTKIAKLTKPVRCIQGSQGAGKTIGIEMILINHCQWNELKEVTIFGAERSKMKKTVINDFVKIMKSNGFYNDNEWNKTESKYTFDTGSYIEFVGLDVADIGKGFRRDVVYFNEANKKGITFDAYTQIASRSNITYLDYNPDRPFWAHTELISDNDTDFLILTYDDNEYLPEGERKAILKYREKGFFDMQKDCTGKDQSNIKNKYWSNRWIVYGLGQTGSMEGVIITDWDIVDNVPLGARYLGTGLDLGFEHDPSVAVDMFDYQGDIILDELFCLKGLHSNEIANKLKGKTVYSDVDPRTISEISRYGINIRQANKGAGSVALGIDILKQRILKPTKRSNNLINAFENYSWDVDKNGNFINKPHHDYSDPVDAVRYVGIMTLGKSNKMDIR